jgi:predicted cupin superfamily sugar epimerase
MKPETAKSLSLYVSMTAQEYIAALGLLPHPEGGYFKEIYRSEGIVSQPNLPLRYSGGRAYSTAIYYLLEGNDFSSLHRLDSDEQWFHIDGCALTIHSISPDGNYEKKMIGKDLMNGESPHAVVTTWMLVRRNCGEEGFLYFGRMRCGAGIRF